MPSPDALQTAAALRFPVFERETATPREKLEAIEDHVCVCAYWQGELHEERLELREAHRERQREWDHLEGWEQFKRNKTEAAVDDAKRQLRPELYNELQDDRHRLKVLTEQIDRLEREHDKASRLYTILTGS